MIGFINKIRCALSDHPTLHVIQSFGPNQRHVGCPHCRREFAMHDGMQAFVKWDEGFEELYGEVMGHDIDGYRKRWIAKTGYSQ